MSLFPKILATALAGAVLGLGATYASLTRGIGFEAVKAGPWRGTPQISVVGGDPYARARVSRSGQVLLGTAEGLSFSAAVDSTGARLRTGCDYRVSGATPVARNWTLGLARPDGTLIATPFARYGFTSSELLRDARGDFHIDIARAARPGNWLPLPGEGDFLLVLRLYDSPHSTSAKTLEARELPTINAERCS